MSDTIPPREGGDDAGKVGWVGGLFDTNSPYVKDALNKIPPGMDADEAAAKNAPLILPQGMTNQPRDPDAPSETQDEMDKALQEMLNGGCVKNGDPNAQQDEQDEQKDEEDDFEEVDCSHCNGTGKVKVTDNGDEVVDEPLEYNQPEKPDYAQQKKMAQWKYDEEQKEVQAEIDRIKREYGKE